jgi:hypothetical protein
MKADLVLFDPATIISRSSAAALATAAFIACSSMDGR